MHACVLIAFNVNKRISLTLLLHLVIKEGLNISRF